MRTQSTLTPKAYRAAMKERMGSRFAIGSDRFTGIFIGRFFYVTHHAGYEWNRRYTCQSNTAWGYIKKIETGCEIRFHKAKGYLCPHLFIFYLLLVSVAFGKDLWMQRHHAPMYTFFMVCFLALGPFIITAFESMTQGSIDGEKSLLGLLYDPTDYLAYLKMVKRKY